MIKQGRGRWVSQGAGWLQFESKEKKTHIKENKVFVWLQYIPITHFGIASLRSLDAENRLMGARGEGG